jgi:DNA-binding transcriptional MocR family regulator
MAVNLSTAWRGGISRRAARWSGARAAVLGVNANTVLRALRTLCDEGLVEFRQGRGVTVTAAAPQQTELVAKARELITLARTSATGRTNSPGSSPKYRPDGHDQPLPGFPKQESSSRTAARIDAEARAAALLRPLLRRRRSSVATAWDDVACG